MDSRWHLAAGSGDQGWLLLTGAATRGHGGLYKRWEDSERDGRDGGGDW